MTDTPADDDYPDIIIRLKASAMIVDDLDLERIEAILLEAAEEITELRRIVRIGRVRRKTVEVKGRG